MQASQPSLDRRGMLALLVLVFHVPSICMASSDLAAFHSTAARSTRGRITVGDRTDGGREFFVRITCMYHTEKNSPGHVISSHHTVPLRPLLINALIGRSRYLQQPQAVASACRRQMPSVRSPKHATLFGCSTRRSDAEVLR